jgi:hypothetical protein
LYQHQPDYYVSDVFQQESAPVNSIKLQLTVAKPSLFSEKDLAKFK